MNDRNYPTLDDGRNWDELALRRIMRASADAHAAHLDDVHNGYCYECQLWLPDQTAPKIHFTRA